MAHSIEPNPAPEMGDEAIATPPEASLLTPTGSPVERSRFSQWLASFGLGEMPHPLLTRGRSSTPRPERR
jgi:hypothetical protein